MKLFHRVKFGYFFIYLFVFEKGLVECTCMKVAGEKIMERRGDGAEQEKNVT